MRVSIFCIVILFWAAGARGQIAPVEISHYVFPDFSPGRVLMKNGSEKKARMNYNTLTREMVFIHNDVKLAVADEESTHIDTIFIEGRKFVPFRSAMAEVFIGEGFAFYCEHISTVTFGGKPVAYGGKSHSSTSSSYAMLVNEASLYELKLPDQAEINPVNIYWLEKKDFSKSFTSLSQVKKYYQQQSKPMSAYLKKHRVRFNDSESMAGLIRHLENQP